MSDDFSQPWIIGVEHLGELLMRFHFVGGVVRDVDLRAVLSERELHDLRTEPDLLSQVSTNVVWPNDIRIDPAMISLIYQGYGARKGWESRAPEPQADARFPVPPLGRPSSSWTLSGSSSISRLETLRRAVERFPDHLQAVNSWWDDALPRLVNQLSGPERKALLHGGRAAVDLLRLHIDDFRKELDFVARMDAVSDGDAELISLIDRACGHNVVWTIKQLAEAAEVFDPFNNPDGFREDVRSRLSASAPESPPGAEDR